jgi:hypothetical protein
MRIAVARHNVADYDLAARRYVSFKANLFAGLKPAGVTT